MIKTFDIFEMSVFLFLTMVILIITVDHIMPRECKDNQEEEFKDITLSRTTRLSKKEIEKDKAKNEAFKRDHPLKYPPEFKPVIPKIIHQTAPGDRSKWHKTWGICHRTWKIFFPHKEFRHILWTDEDLDVFMKKEYPWFYPTYQAYPKNIQRIDIARYFILYKYGGIYADMDFECLKNFYNELDHNKVNIAESPYKENEELHNSMMASPAKHPFWLHVFKHGIKNRNIKHVRTSTGPILLDIAYYTYPYKGTVTILPHKYYNPHIKSAEGFNSIEVRSRHHLSSVWANPNNVLYT